MPTYTHRQPLDRLGATLADPPTGLIEQAPNGVEKRRSPRPHPETFEGLLEVVGRETHLDTQTVCQLAVWHLMSGIVIHVIHLEALVQEAKIETSSFVIERVLFDHPSSDEKSDPAPLLTIIPMTETLYENTNFGTTIIENTLNAYGSNTVLQKMSETTLTLSAHVRVDSRERRRGLRSAYELEFLGEPNDEVEGRKVVVPEYYDRQVAVWYRGVRDMDDETTASANVRELVLRFDVEVDMVRLVTGPGLIDHIHTPLELGTDVVVG